MQNLMIGLTALLFFGAAAANAKLCKECTGTEFPTAVGNCAACEGQTSMGAHKLCHKCAEKKGVCQACGVALETARTKPKPKQIKALIAKLRHKDHAERKAATEKLVKLGPICIDAVENAAESDDPEVATRAKEIIKRLGLMTPHAFVKKHTGAILLKRPEVLKTTYAQKVTLIAGHRLLGDSDGPAIAANAVRERDKLIKPAGPYVKGEPNIILFRRMLLRQKYETIKTKPGDFAVAPAQAVKTKDGRLHFAIKKGDVLVKVYLTEERRSFMLVHLRRFEGKWKVVSEFR